LRDYINEYLAKLVEQSKTHTGEALLAFYSREWDRYGKATYYIHHIFKYLNKHWIKGELDEGKKNIYDVNTLFMVQRRDVLLAATSKEMVDAISQLIDKQRNGEVIEYDQIKQFVDSLDSLDSLDVYRVQFECPFLEATERLYQVASEGFTKNSVVQYMKEVKMRLVHEERLRMYVHADTAIALEKA
jgi:cullin 1